MRLLFAVLLFVAGCGGGGGGEDTAPAIPPTTPEVEESTEPVMEEPEELGDCYETDEETLTEFLQDAIPDRVTRWTQSPTLRIAGEATSQERRIVKESVENINSALPDEYDIVTKVDAPALSEIVPEGEIYIEFAPGSEWIGHSGNAVGWADTKKEGGQIVSSHVWIQENRVHLGFCDESLSYLVAHELLHALGLDHVSGMWQWRSVMVASGASAVPACFGTDANGVPYPERIEKMGVPSQIDRDALRATYSLENGDYPEELRIEPEQECQSGS